MSTNSAKDETATTETKKVFKCDMDEKAIQDYLVMSGVASYETVEVEKKTDAKKAFIKINNKRK